MNSVFLFMAVNSERLELGMRNSVWRQIIRMPTNFV
jgi:hypothetical protein